MNSNFKKLIQSVIVMIFLIQISSHNHAFGRILTINELISDMTETSDSVFIQIGTTSDSVYWCMGNGSVITYSSEYPNAIIFTFNATIPATKKLILSDIKFHNFPLIIFRINSNSYIELEDVEFKDCRIEFQYTGNNYTIVKMLSCRFDNTPNPNFGSFKQIEFRSISPNDPTQDIPVRIDNVTINRCRFRIHDGVIDNDIPSIEAIYSLRFYRNRRHVEIANIVITHSHFDSDNEQMRYNAINFENLETQNFEDTGNSLLYLRNNIIQITDDTLICESSNLPKLHFAILVQGPYHHVMIKRNIISGFGRWMMEYDINGNPTDIIADGDIQLYGDRQNTNYSDNIKYTCIEDNKISTHAAGIEVCGGDSIWIDRNTVTFLPEPEHQVPVLFRAGIYCCGGGIDRPEATLNKLSYIRFDTVYCDDQDGSRDTTMGIYIHSSRNFNIESNLIVKPSGSAILFKYNNMNYSGVQKSFGNSMISGNTIDYGTQKATADEIGMHAWMTDNFYIQGFAINVFRGRFPWCPTPTTDDNLTLQWNTVKYDSSVVATAERFQLIQVADSNDATPPCSTEPTIVQTGNGYVLYGNGSERKSLNPESSSDTSSINNPELLDNFPNPFNSTTTIHFTLKDKSEAILEIFNMMGEKIKTLISQTLPAGQHSFVWNSTNEAGEAVSSGIYFYRLKTDSEVISKKMILLK